MQGTSPRNLKDYVGELGDVTEYDIPFWKRYLIDKDISPLYGIRAKVVDDNGGKLIIENREPADATKIELSHLCFDIETYNPRTFPNMEKDPVDNDQLLR